MAVSKQITQDATGVVVAYHVVQSVTIDKISKTVTGSVASYVSAEAKAAGKQMVGYPTGVTVDGLPGDKENAFSFFEKQAVLPQPTDSGSTPLAPYVMNRYLLADGAVVADV